MNLSTVSPEIADQAPEQTPVQTGCVGGIVSTATEPLRRSGFEAGLYCLADVVERLRFAMAWEAQPGKAGYWATQKPSSSCSKVTRNLTVAFEGVKGIFTLRAVSEQPAGAR
jgi:hypothetical protein